MENLEKLAELAQSLPASAKQNALDLVERMSSTISGIGDTDKHWRPDTLKLVQGTSDRTKLPKGANIGSFVHGEEILEQPLEVIPFRTWISRQLWSPNQDEAKLLCSSPDGVEGFMHGQCKVCPYSQFDTENNKSQCNKTITAIVATASLDKVFNINFSKSNYTNGLEFQKLMTKAGVATYKRTYKLESKTSAKAKNVEIIQVSTGGVVDREVQPFVAELFAIVTDDRKKFLENFKEYLSNKASNPMLAAPVADQEGQILIEAPVAQAPNTEGQKYKM